MSIRRERAAFEKSVLPHLDALYGSGFRLTRNASDAEDLVQDTLVRAYRFWGSFTEGSNCKAWLFKILTNTFINSYQRRKRSHEVLAAAAAEQTTTDGTLIQTRALCQLSAEDLLIEQCLSEDVERALAAIPADFRIAVVLCDVEGFTYKEIAEIIDCPVGTVMSRLYRGRRLLQNELQEFAKAQGFIKPESEDATSKLREKLEAEDQAATINLADYRQTKGTQS